MEPKSPPPTVRFAPSPTGLLHIGNARTALINGLYAKREGGTFILRLDDTDRARSEEHFVDAIRTDLAWLGIPPTGRKDNPPASPSTNLHWSDCGNPDAFMSVTKPKRNLNFAAAASSPLTNLRFTTAPH